MEITKYEQSAITEIHAWKNPELGWFGEAMKVINRPLDVVGDKIMDTAGIGTVIKKSVEGLTSVCNDLAQRSVRTEAIFEEYRKAGFPMIHCHEGVFDLELKS